MYKHIQNYKKLLLAVFGTLLMIAFLLPVGMGGGSQNDPEIGKIDGEGVRASSLRAGAMEWEFLTRNVIVASEGQQQQRQPISMGAEALGAYAEDQIQKNPEMYFLLLDEARRKGTAVSQDGVETRLRNGGVFVVDPSTRQPVEFTKLTDARLIGQTRQAVSNVYAIRAHFNQIAGAVKVTEPLRQMVMASEFQTVRVSAVDFPASKFTDTIAAPTTQEVTAHFEKFADLDARATETNPLGFGYRYPDRVQLQYVELPQAELRRAVLQSRPIDRWEVEAIRYYNKNQNLFPSTRPLTEVTDGFSLGTSSTKPTTRPFEEVRDTALDAVMKPEIGKLSERVLRQMSETLRKDHQAFHAAGGATAIPVGVAAPTTRPVSSLGVPVDSFEYLQKLAAKVQTEFGVLPTVVSRSSDWLTAEQLRAMPGIGTSRTDDATFASMATQNVEAFLPDTLKDAPGTLALYEPSPVLKDFNNSAYVFRVTAVRPAGRPESLADVAQRVELDWREAAAYEAAKAAAQKALDAARDTSLISASGALKLNVVTTDALNSQGFGPPISALSLEGENRAAFVREAFKLLRAAPTTQPKANNPKPVSMIELPTARQVMVVELEEVLPLYEAGVQSAQLSAMAIQLQMQISQQLQLDWYNFDSVKARTGFKPFTSGTTEAPVPAAASAM